MTQPAEWLEFGQKFHGHKCPAMPMGLRVGAAAMNTLGVERAKDGQIVAFVDLGEDHCATCYADGLQVIMGTTFGKGNIKKTQKGKWAVTLVDRKSGKAVRVTPKAEAMLANKQTSFFKDYREKDIPASKAPGCRGRPSDQECHERNRRQVAEHFQSLRLRSPRRSAQLRRVCVRGMRRDDRYAIRADQGRQESLH